MIVTKVQLPPQVANWYNTLKLQPINFLKHDLYSGWIIAHIFYKVFGDSKFELRTFTNNTSVNNARHNWSRILELQALHKLPTEISADMVAQIINAKDEGLLLDIVIKLYEVHTGLKVYKSQFNTIPAVASKTKSKVVTKQMQNINLPTGRVLSTHLPLPQMQLPSNMPQFCRMSFINSRKLIDHLSEACRQSITNFPEIKDYIEMLDPRADLCYPFPQLLLRLPAEFCTQVCEMLVTNVDVEILTQCITEDFELFYDAATILLQSVIALNQVAGNARQLFDIVNGHLCTIVESVKAKSLDCVYMIYNSIILNRLVKEIPLVNYSLVHFFKLCTTCTGGLFPDVFQQVMMAVLNNLKQTSSNVSENRLRLEILISFTIFGTQEKKYLELIFNICIQKTLCANLLPDNEKYIALDLMTRCFAINPSSFSKYKSYFLILVQSLINGPIQIQDQNSGQDGSISVDENEYQPLTIRAKFGIVEKEIQFNFDRLKCLTYEQVLFVLVVIFKVIGYSESDSDIVMLQDSYANKLLQGWQELPPCHFFIGVMTMYARHYNEIVELSMKLNSVVTSIDFTKLPQVSNDCFDEVQAAIQGNTDLRQLLFSLVMFLLSTPSGLNSLLSIMSGKMELCDVIGEFVQLNDFDTSCYLQVFGPRVPMEVAESKEVSQAIIDDVELIEDEMVQSQLHTFSEVFCLSPIIQKKIVHVLHKGQELQNLAPLFLFYLVQDYDIGLVQLNLMIQFIIINPSMSAYIYKTLLDKLFSNALTDGLTEVVSDFILCLCRQMIKSDVIDDVREDFILSLQTLTDYCFSFANIRGGKKNVEEQQKRILMQERCLVLLKIMAEDIGMRPIVADMIRLNKFENYGNDHLDRFNTDVVGDI